MPSTRFALLAASMLAFGLAAAPAQAQLSRTFVSAMSGDDANNCDRPTPCRTFQGAHDKTNPDGEITVLHPGGYGSVTITKSISIVNDGVGEASILVSGNAIGITIDGGPATYVNLRGITVQGIGFGGGNGLLFKRGFSLTITNCVFRNHTGFGIIFRPEVAGTSNLSISNTLVADNGRDGIDIIPTAAGATVLAALDHVQTVDNSISGIGIDGSFVSGTGTTTIKVAVTDSVSANNGRDGVAVFSVTNQATAALMMIRSAVANNKDLGLHAISAASLRIGQSAITGNNRTWSASSGAVLQSFGDNYVAGNADGDPALPTIAKK